MSTETSKYFEPDTDLRAVYGGGAILDGGDSAEVTLLDLTQRHICRQVNWPSDHTRFIGQLGSASGSPWMKISDNLYGGISAHLSTAELATVISTAPVGFSNSSGTILFQPYPDKTTVYLRGDSISSGQGTTSNNTIDTFVGQAMESIQPQTWDGGTNRSGVSDNYAIHSFSLGASSWANTGGGGSALYPEREDLAYNQRTRTLPINGGNSIFIYWLGTNDVNYDGTQTGTTIWARAATRIAALRSEFPNLIIIVCTLIRRGEDDVETVGTQNFNLALYNTLAAANYVSAGANILLDLDGASTELNTTTGDTGNATYYADEVHITTAGHALLTPATKTAILAAEALF